MSKEPETTRDASPDAERNSPARVATWIAIAAAATAATIYLAKRMGEPKPLTLAASIGEARAGHDLDIERIRRTVETLAAARSRVSGRPGNDAAVRAILDALGEAGVADVEVQEFPVAVPHVRSAHLEARGAGGPVRLELHPLWPNLARTSQTPPGGLTGPLVYVGRGTDPELAGKRIQDALLVIDWDCDIEWLSAGEFGARAVIFRGTDRANGYTARSKFLTVPANIPRFYVPEESLPALDALWRAGLDATVHCRMTWRSATAKNVLARVCGDPPGAAAAADERAIVFHAYYDSISVVPGLSPGAEQACGAATLLELVRFFAEADANARPRRPVYALFTGAHGQALAGMIRFIGELRGAVGGTWTDRKKQANPVLAGLGQPGLFVGLDITSRSERLGVFCAGAFRGQWIGRLRPRFSVLGQKLDKFARARSAEAAAAGEPSSFVDCINLTLGRGWWTYFPYQAPFESEIPTLATYPGITLATINDDRRHVDTPHDTPGRMRFDLLARQLVAKPGRRVGLANVALALASWQGPFVSSALADRWASVAGRVVWLDQQRDYTPSGPVAKSVVFLKTNRGDKFLMGTRGLAAALADEQGKFRFDGLATVAANRQFERCLVEAYGLATEEFLQANPRAVAEYLTVVRRAGQEIDRIEPDGSIIFAADMARAGEYPWRVKVLKAEQNVNLVVFPCRSISLFALTDPREYVELTDLQMLDVATNSPPFQFGHSITDVSSGRAVENCITLWADPTLRTRLTFGFGFKTRRLILINNDANDPVGEGFVLGELATIPSMVLQGASDMWNLDESRIAKLQAHGISNPRVRQIHAESREYLELARRALADNDYRTYRTASSNGWALEGKVYAELLDMTNNMIRGVLFYLAVLIPFSYCLERLLLAGGTIRKRILGMVVIFAIGFVILAVAHPAFRFTLTPLMVLLAFVILALGTTVSALVVGKFDRMLQERKQKLTGLHEDIRNVGGILVHAIDLGIANIRRRPKRGFLTAMTIVLVTFTLLSFTSLVPELNVSKLDHATGEPSAYRGLLARSRSWGPLPAPLYDSLRRTYSDANAPPATAPGETAPGAADCVVAGRAWFFSDLSGELSQIDLAVADARPGPATQPAASQPHDPDAARRYFTAVSLLCMEHTEPAVTGIDRTLVAGRWFRDEDDLGIILPRHVAEYLGLGPGDIGRKILLFGKELPLRALYDAAKLDAMRDVDGEPLTPVNFVLQEQIQAEREDLEATADTLEEYAHHASHELAIIPLQYGRQLGATYRSIAVKTDPNMVPNKEADRFARRSNVAILSSDGESVTLHASVESSRFSAATTIIVPTVLGFVMVLGTMLGSVYERRREIFVYNSVGLSPVNVSSLFLAESSVYAILGASLGYLLGQAISKVLLSTGLLSGLNLNYSAGATVFVTVLTMVIVLMSTLYPARQAFLAAVPETHRAPGVGEDQAAADRIAIFMPFVATEGHLLGMQAYMHEYLDSVQGVTVGQVAVDDLAARIESHDGRRIPVLAFRAWLAPFDLGVSHDVELRIVHRADRGVYQYHLTAVRFSGDQQNWRRLTPRFLLAVRKQLLMWRILSPEAIADYVRRGEKLFGVPAASGEEPTMEGRPAAATGGDE